MANNENQSKNATIHFAMLRILTRSHSSKSPKLSTELFILKSGQPRNANSTIIAVCVQRSIFGNAMATVTYVNTTLQVTCFH